jgi:hypothetical protein
MQRMVFLAVAADSHPRLAALGRRGQDLDHGLAHLVLTPQVAGLDAARSRFVATWRARRRVAGSLPAMYLPGRCE